MKKIHKCRNPRYCIICRQKQRKKIITFFKNNPNTVITYDILEKQFQMPYETIRTIMNILETKRIVIRKYSFNKKLATGSGIKTYFLLYDKFNPHEGNSKSWVKVF